MKTLLLALLLIASPFDGFIIKGEGFCKVAELTLPCVRMFRENDTAIYTAIFTPNGQILLWILREKDGEIEIWWSFEKQIAEAL